MKTERKITTPNALNFPIVYTTTKNKRRVSFTLWGFLCVCPEPVLVKCSFLCINGFKRPFERTQLGPTGSA